MTKLKVSPQAVNSAVSMNLTTSHRLTRVFLDVMTQVLGHDSIALLEDEGSI